MDQHEDSALPWQEIAGMLLRRRQLILVTLVSGTLTAFLLAFTQAPTYRTSAKLMVTSKRPRITVSPDPGHGPILDRVTEQDLNSEVALLQSESLVREVVEASLDQMPPPSAPGLASQLANLASYPLRLPGMVYRRVHGMSPPSPMDERVANTIKHLQLSAITGSNLIQVAYEGSKPQWVAEFVNRLVRRHVERQVQLNQQSDALGFFESQRQLLSDRLREAEQALRKFYEGEAIEPGSEEREALNTRLVTVRAALAQSETELAETTARGEFLAKEINNHSSTIHAESGQAQGSPVQMIRSRIMELELQRSELLSKFAPTSMKIQDLDRQIEEARRLFAAEEKTNGGALNPAHQTLTLDLAQTQAQTAALKARVGALQLQLAADLTKLEHVDRIAPQQERLEQEVVTAKESLLTYSKKQEEARFSEALDESKIVNVTIVEPAAVPNSPQPSKQQLIVLLGAFMSLTAGIGLAFVRDRLDPTVKSAREAQKLAKLPILAEITL